MNRALADYKPETHKRSNRPADDHRANADFWNSVMRMGQFALVRSAVFCGLALALGCGERRIHLSPCRAQVLKDSERYISRHTPDAEWQPLIEAELQRCIEQEEAK
jgi:hypothetical protein